jgi:hypothetical protein
MERTQRSAWLEPTGDDRTGGEADLILLMRGQNPARCIIRIDDQDPSARPCKQDSCRQTGNSRTYDRNIIFRHDAIPG